MKRSKRLLLLLSAGLLMASPAAADVVWMKNGDVLRGTVVSMEDGKLLVHTAEAGDVTVEAGQVKTFSTDAPVGVRLPDGTVVNRRIAQASSGMVQMQGGLLGDEVVSIGSIKSINLPPVKWAGDVKFGGLIVRGNTDTDTVNFGFDLSRTTEKDSLTFNGNYIYGRTLNRQTGVDTPIADSWGAEGKYQRNIDPKRYAFLDVPVAHDRLALLYLRIDPSLGLGDHLITKPDFTFTGEAGVAGILEQYDNDTPRRDSFSLKLAYHLTKKINDKVSLFNDLSYFPGLSNARQFVVDADAGLDVKLTKHFFGELKVSLDHDNTPAYGALKTNTRYELNLGYSF